MEVETNPERHIYSTSSTLVIEGHGTLSRPGVTRNASRSSNGGLALSLSLPPDVSDHRLVSATNERGADPRNDKPAALIINIFRDQ